MVGFDVLFLVDLELGFYGWAGELHLARGSKSKATELASERAPAASRLGLLLFAIYLAFYLGFVLISAFACDWLETIVAGGLNLAVVYGFGLILLALILAMIYGGLRVDRSTDTH